MKRSFANLLLAAAMAAPFSVLTQAFPSKPIRILVPYPAGQMIAEDVARWSAVVRENDIRAE